MEKEFYNNKKGSLLDDHRMKGYSIGFIMYKCILIPSFQFKSFSNFYLSFLGIISLEFVTKYNLYNSKDYLYKRTINLFGFYIDYVNIVCENNPIIGKYRNI